MDVQRLVDAYIIGLGDSADNSSLRQALVARISSGDVSLLELVQALGSYLASEEAARRSKGAHMLADVLADLPESAIPAAATARLVQFLCARLADATCVPHIISSLATLQRLPSFTDQCAVDVANALFKEVHVQSFQHATRSTAYGLVDQMVRDRPAAVQSMGNDFILGFAQMLDGEKDPRALMVAFQITPRLVDLVDARKHAEDLFDVIFCYFPITFKHRDGDPSAISPEALKAALRTAITCSPYFGDMAVKPLVEKTAAASPSVKIDAYETLAAAARKYDPATFDLVMEVLVEQIREDVVMAADEAVVEAALNTLEAVYGAITPTAPSSSGAASQVVDSGESATPLDYVLKDAVFQLTADEIKSPDQVGKILRAAARSSAYNCNVVSDAVLPIVTERLDTTDTLTVRRELMDVLNYVLSASCDVERKAECLVTDKTNLLNIYRLESSVPLDKEYSFLHITRLKGITLLILLPEFLDSNEKAVALQTIGRAAIERNEDENVNKEATHLLVQLSRSNPDQVQATVLPMFLDALCQEVVAVQKVAGLLNALGAIGVAATGILLPVLDGLTTAITLDKLAPAHHLPTVTTIRKMAEAAVATNANTAQDIMASVIHPLLEWVDRTVGLQRPAFSQVVVEVAKATATVLSKLDASVQEQQLRPLFDRYLAATLKPASADDPGSQLLPVYSAAVCACWPQTQIPVDNLAEYLASLAVAALSTENTVQRDVCFEIISSVVNKAAAGQQPPHQRGYLANHVLERADTVADAGIASALLRHWLARALVSCNDKRGYECTRKLLALIAQGSPYSAAVAEGFNIILGTHDWAVTPATHGVFKVLAKQRFYATVVPEITRCFKDAASDQIKSNLLVALTHSVRHMPKSVLMSGIEDIVPLLLSAIRLTAGSLKAASIRTITMVVLEMPEMVKDEVTTSIIPLLIASFAQADSANTVEVRRAACDALELLPEKYGFAVIHTASKSVLRALTNARDDRKRLVRADAVKAYNKWLSLGDM